MAAYGASVSLKNTIQRILQSSRISLVPASLQILQSANESMCRLQKVLLKLDDTSCKKIRAKVNDLDERMKEVVWEFEDLLESHVYEHILPQLEGERDRLSFYVDLQSLRQSVDCFIERVTVMEAEYDNELLNMHEEEGEPLSSRIDFGGINSKMVGLSDEFEQVKDYLINDRGNRLLVTGMAGVGKTALAKKVFDDSLIQRRFGHRAWIKVGRKCEFKETIRCILAQVDPNTHGQIITLADDNDGQELVGLLKERLKDKKCLIVFDDVWEWDTRVMYNLHEENVRILITSRLRIEELNNLATKATLRLLNIEESKKLLGERLFGEEGFPPHLEKLGEKIAYKCEGLPLMIVTVAKLLSKEDMTRQYWTEVAEKQHNSVFVEAYNQISEVLFPSYDYLPQYFKMFFLYLGAFPPYSDIEIHNLFDRLCAEGFLEPTGEQTLEDFMVECLVVLAHKYHLVLLGFDQESWFLKKELHVHSCWQYLCRKEASKIKFLHVLQSFDDVVKDQRRLCAHSNTLFAFKEVHESIKSDCAPTNRSLLCLGPFHQYPLPINAMDFKLLKVLDALQVRYYHFPLEILKLVCLNYLALTCNKELPVSISNLFHLQFLIIFQHTNIKKRGAISYMPVEIWDMQQLQHIYVVGRDLPTPNSDVTLDKLSSLVGVSTMSCTTDILKRIPNLKELIIQMELKPYDDDNDSNSLNGLEYISEELRNLEALSYFVKNPELKYECRVPLSVFPSSLTILHLSGLGCPWRYMNDIGVLLPNLVNLRLEHYAFQGSEWNIESKCFLKLEKLVMEDTDLVRWRAQHGSLPRLDLLSIRHCYKLQQLDWMCSPSTVTTRTIELVECNPLVVASALQLPEDHFTVLWQSSF
ncbi:putative late blight resistance protein homolog R1C-3 [Salvia splendens]|uniref:putative late blight resistance protein homolog R1C-3 n=1 Tax=Salvia splendens TaxID=180675 RepID=UPI001C2539E9|nr:putative late blight resistance protein homolog R1C-3 [Salvia splendens]